MKCKNNHESTAADFCSVCGIEMTESADTGKKAVPGSQEPENCPVCGSIKTDNFCGDCGYNFITKVGGIVEPPPLQPTVVTAQTVASPTSPASAEAPAQGADAAEHPSADAANATVVQASSAPEPSSEASGETHSTTPSERLEVHLTIDTSVEGAPQTPMRIYPLESRDYSIGRPSQSRKIKPAIPADGDDGVSHKHALIREHGDSFAIMDLGSSNGTRLNGVEIIPNTVHTLKKDDVIAIGRVDPSHYSVSKNITLRSNHGSTPV